MIAHVVIRSKRIPWWIKCTTWRYIGAGAGATIGGGGGGAAIGGGGGGAGAGGGGAASGVQAASSANAATTINGLTDLSTELSPE